MSTLHIGEAERGARRSRGKGAVLLIIPFLTLGYQVAAKEVAERLNGVPFGWRWAHIITSTAWLGLLLACELASLIVWMVVLADIKLSTAFPMTAFAYFLVIGVSWLLFHETINSLTILGSATILIGVWLIGRESGEVRT